MAPDRLAAQCNESRSYLPRSGRVFGVRLEGQNIGRVIATTSWYVNGSTTPAALDCLPRTARAGALRGGDQLPGHAAP